MNAHFFYTNPKSKGDVWHRATVSVSNENPDALKKEMESFKAMGYAVVETLEVLAEHALAGRGF